MRSLVAAMTLALAASAGPVIATTEAALDSTPTRDFYAAIANLPEIDGQASQAVILRIYRIPAMLPLWTGFIFTALGGMLAAMGAFRRLQNKEET